MMSLLLNCFRVLCPHRMTPESIRWLIGKRKKEEVEALLKKIADTNGYTLPSYTADLLEKVNALLSSICSVDFENKRKMIINYTCPCCHRGNRSNCPYGHLATSYLPSYQLCAKLPVMIVSIVTLLPVLGIRDYSFLSCIILIIFQSHNSDCTKALICVD